MFDGIAEHEGGKTELPIAIFLPFRSLVNSSFVLILYLES